MKKTSVKKSSGFLRKLTGAYMVLSILLVILFLAFFFRYIEYSGVKLSLANQSALPDQALLYMEKSFKGMDDISYRIMNDSKLLSVFGELQFDTSPDNYFDSDVLSAIEIGTIITTLRASESPMWRVTIYNQYGDYISSGAPIDKNAMKALDFSRVKALMFELDKTSENMVMRGPDKDEWYPNIDREYITLYRALKNSYSDKICGVIEIKQSVDVFSKVMDIENMKNITLSVINSDGGIVLTKQAQKEMQGKSYEISLASKRYGWSVVLSQNEDAVLAPYMPLLKGVSVAAIIVLIIVLVAISLISKRMSRPLVKLKETVGAITYDHLPDNYSSHENIDEVRELDIAFNAMLHRLNESMHLERKALLLALQSQMNPHFLYNTLAVIGSAGMEGKNEKVALMCSQLSSMLRYTADYEDTIVTLSDEMEHALSYLELMRARYEDGFDYTMDIDSGCRDIRLPKMVIQPIAENCFSHGFASLNPPYVINIKAYKEENFWVICVSDNGVGINEELKKEIFSRIEQYEKNLSENLNESHISGLGLVSTALRLHLVLGNGFSLEILQNKPRGAIVVLKGEIKC